MSQLERFLDPVTVSLKICGVTVAEEAERLADMGVHAFGVNFWSKSKRYLDPRQGQWLEALAGRILRVGVFVNPNSEEAIDLFKRGWIDVIQLHGDENPMDAAPYRDAGLPFIKAIGVSGNEQLASAREYGANALLMDAHAPGVYGGTGDTFDWNTAIEFMSRHSEPPVILAGGITPDNAAQAVAAVRPAAIDIASGAELSPGLKDFDKVRQLIQASQGC